MNKFLTDLIARKKAEMEALQNELDGLKPDENGESLKRATAIGENLVSIRSEIAEAEKQLAKIENGNQVSNEPKPDARSFNPLASYGQGASRPKTSLTVDSRSTEEYSKAFMDYYQTGVRSDILMYRDNEGKIFSGVQVREAGPNVLADLGVMLPETVIQNIIKDVSKVYGQLYNRVHKTFIKGGIKVPIGSFGATVTRIEAESGTQAENQKGGKITGYVRFDYKLGSIRLSQSLLASVITVPVFEAELSKVIVEAYVREMDNEILNGVGDNEQMEGILTEAKKESDSRIPAENIIEFTQADMLDWKKWQEKLFAKIPLSMRSLKPVFVMTADTYEANIKTLADDNNRPVYNETFNPVDGAEISRFKGKEVVFVEDGFGIENFNDATDGEFFGLYLVPDKAYMINENLQFAVRRFYDDNTDRWIEKALFINDGKILDPKYLYLLKKKVTV